MTTKELRTGTAGDGATVWMVVTMRRGTTGRWIYHTERFDTEAEAVSWRRWA